MVEPKKITIIAPEAFGYIHILVNRLKQKQNVITHHINFSEFSYIYSSNLEKIGNFLTKSFLHKNKKDEYRSACIIEALSNVGHQDIILVIRPDKIQYETLLKLKQHTDLFYAFYFDAISNYKKKIDLINIFDKVFSYEKEDVSKYGLTFITNYIYQRDSGESMDLEYQVFNISSYDNRFDRLKSIASYLESHSITYKIIVRKEKSVADDKVDVVTDYLNLDEIELYIKKSQVILDIQKENQSGLSFRVFEALGFEKKLITTNSDIVNYDFYNPNNILVLQSTDDLSIPKTFFKRPYQKISEYILKPYTLDGWIKKVFDV